MPCSPGHDNRKWTAYAQLAEVSMDNHRAETRSCQMKPVQRRGLFGVPGISLILHLNLHRNTNSPWTAGGIWMALLGSGGGEGDRKKWSGYPPVTDTWEP